MKMMVAKNRAIPKNTTNPSIMSILEGLIPPGHFILAAREWLFTDYFRNRSGQYLTKILKAAGDEGIWLLQQFGENVPNFGRDFMKKMRWISEKLAGKEDVPWANYYRGRAAIFCINTVEGINLLKRSLDAGFSPAASYLAVIHSKIDKRIYYTRLAAKLNDPYGLYLLSITKKSYKERIELLRKAADLGVTESMYDLMESMIGSWDIDMSTILGRYVLMTAQQLLGPQKQKYFSYEIGRQLYGYEQLWDDNIRLIPKLQKYVNIYATVTERARRAALQTTFGLRTYLGRDVARIIGKMVYATRFTEDWELN